jgi:tRNA-Thr(GGU) m(6)t(6)A37 methyltransferase TsaA
MDIRFQPIGLIHTPFSVPANTPIQSARSQASGWIEIFPDYAAGLQDIEAFSHIYLVYYLHGASEIQLTVEPFLDNQKHGIFATRHPFRPNHIGLSIVQLLSRQENRLNISGVDMFDQTPLLDIKPYVPEFDRREEVRAGWYERRAKP